ncbi:condensin complex subunit 3-like isoform X2 [Centruroides sculpturatus]|uniref:condensin complex subunit 3-like isoform X2 n=1 Tax=Centruroides sculpturatus TaxID=218467 RepID=UPI000C6E51CE|nr:condensin complex subunit 3-like isoform X2 [Centruroides sculpturatus]
MNEIFENCQNRLQSHPKLILSLKNIFRNTPFDEFLSEFISYLKHSLVISHHYPAVERTLEFVSKFVTELYKEEEEIENDENKSNNIEHSQNHLINKLFEYLIQIRCAKDQAVRYRVCYLINKLLINLPAEADIDDILYEKLCRSMLERLQDKGNNVRTQAVHALSRLQDPSNNLCPVIEAYLFHLKCDPCAEVRRAVILNIGASSKTLIPIINRTKDVKDIVRRAAYICLAERIHIKSLSISQRILLLQRGLNDRSEIVRSTVEKKLLLNWLELCENDIVKFLQCLDVQESEEISEKALNSIFSMKTPEILTEQCNILNNENMIPKEGITCENAFYWYCLCKYLRSLKTPTADECLDSILPNLVSFCSFVESYILQSQSDIEKLLDHCFISCQLINLISECEFSDQAGRKAFQQLFLKLVEDSNVYLTLMEPLVKCYTKLHLNPEICLCNIAEMISDIQQPIMVITKECSPRTKKDTEMKIAKISVELNCLRDCLEENLKNAEYSAAQKVKDKITELEALKEEYELLIQPNIEEVRKEKNDSQILLKCITIICETLKQINLKTVTPVLQSTMETLLLPGIQNEDPAIRKQAVMGLGLCCLLNYDIACKHFFLFLQIAQVDQESIQVTAFKAIFDLLLLYGLDSFQKDFHPEDTDTIPETPTDEGDEITTENISKDLVSNILAILSSQLNSEFEQVRTVMAEGIGKLLFQGRVTSSNFLTQLILLWYNPVTEDDCYLRHFLGVFLPAFASSKRCNQDQFEEAFLPTLNALFDAPYSSPLAQIDQTNVAKFMLELTNPYLIPNEKQDITIHDHLSIGICNEILKNPHSGKAQLFAKILNYLKLSSSALSILNDLDVLCEDILKIHPAVYGVKSVEKFHQTVKSYLLMQNKSNQSMEYNKYDDKESIISCKSSQPLSPIPISEIRNGRELDIISVSSSPQSNITSVTTTITTTSTDQDNEELMDQILDSSPISLTPKIVTRSRTRKDLTFSTAKKSSRKKNKK